jgi:ketosteroid isomerase-like protein
MGPPRSGLTVSRREKWVISVVVMVGMLAFAQNLAAGPAAKEGESLIAKLVHTYADSVSAADTKLAAEVWWNSPDVSFIHPLGHEHGWNAIKTNIYEKLMGETFSDRKLSIKDLAIHVYKDAAWAEFYWDFDAKFRKDGTPITTHGRESQVYLRRDGRWRLVHVHYSGIPVVAERNGF